MDHLTTLNPHSPPQPHLTKPKTLIIQKIGKMFGPEKFWIQKNSGPKNFRSRKKNLPKNQFGSKKIFDLENILRPKRILGFKNFVY